MLSLYAHVAPEAWRFRTNAYGRPAIDEPATERDLTFNLSHTDGLVALAVAEACNVGIDVERVDHEIDLARLAPFVMARSELEAIETAAPGHARRDLFFTFWTLKEAYIKARGMGLSLPLKGIAFEVSDGQASISFDQDLIDDDPARWQFRRLAPTPLHTLAVAFESANLVVRPRWTSLA